MGDAAPLVPMLIAGAAGGLVSASALWVYSIYAPRCQFWAPVIRSIRRRDAVTLTFDDGPHPEFTPRILDILAEHNVKASFFIIGQNARQHPDLLRRIHAEGHLLGNHSLDHDPKGLHRKRAYWDDQLLQTQHIIAGATGTAPIFFRPPGGYKTRHIAAAAAALHLPIVGWSVRGLDIRITDPAELTRRTLNRTTGHDILVLHDGLSPDRPMNATQEHTVGALPAILEGIRAKKLEILSLLEALTPPNTR